MIAIFKYRSVGKKPFIEPINEDVDYEISIIKNIDVMKRTLQELLHHYSAQKFYTKFDAGFRKDRGKF